MAINRATIAAPPRAGPVPDPVDDHGPHTPGAATLTTAGGDGSEKFPASVQTLEDRGWMPKIAAGWHICLDVADRMMAGRPLGRIVADEAKEHGWEELRDAYSAALEKAKAGPAGTA